MDKKHLACQYSAEQQKQAFEFAQGYKIFLDEGKTERMAIHVALEAAKAHGYCSLAENSQIKIGDKFYFLNQDRNLCLVHIGQEPLTAGLSIVAAHVDSPRLDLKPQPLYEELNLALLKTHYYGGIKKYQWGSRPLALHGIVCLTSGETKHIHIGEDPEDPVFCIPDLLPHLDRKIQRERKADEVLRGEELRIIIASLPSSCDESIKFPVKQAVLDKLNKEFGIQEEDFLSAELQIVPAGKSRDVGLDRALVGGYGQDDRVCSYAGLQALLEQKNPQKTAMLFLADKEEIGSVGTTGMQSSFWRYVIAQLLSNSDQPTDPQTQMQVLWRSICLSADVTAAIDPIFKDVHEEQNSAKLNFGLTLTKYTGSAGKSHASDADPRLIASLRKILSDAKIPYQVGQMGKVDEGGGGTVAAFFANHGVRTLDCGVPILSMHSPFEVLSKLDLYAMFCAYQSFFTQGLPHF
ncbi:MAG: aminopeptidase [Spirochaetia bacterium]